MKDIKLLNSDIPQMNLTTKLKKKIPILKNQKLLLSIIIISFWIWSFPNTWETVRGGLDPSWHLALHIGTLQNFVWGTDIIWPNGPLGYLLFPLNIDNELWTQSFFYWVIMHSLFFLTLNFFLLKTESPLRNAIIFGFFWVIFMNFQPIYLPFFGILLGFFLYFQYNNKKILLIPLAVSTAFLLYVKLDLGIGTFSILLLSCFYLLIKKQWKEPIILISIYFISVFFIWINTGSSFDNFQNYIFTSLDIASGYPLAMSYDVMPGIFILMPISAGLVIFFWILEYKKNSKESLKFLFISPVIVFFFFKIGYVRDDSGHMMHFFLLISGFFLILTFLNKNESGKLLKFFTYGLVILFIFVGSMTLYEGRIIQQNDSLEIESVSRTFEKLISHYTKTHLTNLPQKTDFLVNDDSFSPIREEQKENIKKAYPLSQKTLEVLNDHTIDVVPWDVAMAYAYGLNYHPRPVFQSYSVYTANLDKINAEFYEKDTAPKFVLYETKTIDNRFPLFEEPATLRSLICNYHFLEQDGSILILERNDKNVCTDEKVISNHEIVFDQQILVPTQTEA